MDQQTYVAKTQSGIVLVEFGAQWCVPCKHMAPILQRVLETFPQITLVNIDVDQSARLVQQIGIASVPTLIVYRDGNPVKTLYGSQTERALSKALQECA